MKIEKGKMKTKKRKRGKMKNVRCKMSAVKRKT